MKKNKFIQRVRLFFDETDIFSLVYIPPMIGFPIYILFIILISLYIKNDLVIESLGSLGTSAMSLAMCIGSIGAMYKKELPWVSGKIYSGNWAIVSGGIGTVAFGFFGIANLLYGLSILIKPLLGI